MRVRDDSRTANRVNTDPSSERLPTIGLLGYAYIVAAALLWGTLDPRLASRFAPEWTHSRSALTLGALLLLPAVAFAPKAGAQWLVLLFLGAAPTYVAYLLYSFGLARVEATRAAAVATLEPVAAAVPAYLVWGEALRGLGYAGAVLVLAGVLVVAIERDTRQPLEPPHEGPAPVT